MSFEDHFSKQAEAYARHRPQYPADLFEWIASLAPDHDRAWDCGTGNGQAAQGLARHFRSVIATDPSANQIANAPAQPQIEYRIARAEESGLDDQSVDTVTVALALHWFDLDRFYAEVRRVLKPAGVIVAWGYYLPHITPDIDRVLKAYDNDVLRGFWSPRLSPVRDGYRSLPFPFEEMTAPEFSIETAWTFDELIGYLHSWSGAQAYFDARGRDPIDEIQAELARAWGSIDYRGVRWTVYLRAGHVGGSQ